MPKLKTHKGVARRFKKTGTGKLMYYRAGRRHLLTGKSSRAQRKLRKRALVAKVSEEKLKQLIPYGS
jgi:large subunit ribosomal protein L35